MFSGASISAWYDFIVDPIVNLFTTLVNSLASIVITPIAGILYTLQIGFFLLMDCIQMIFRRIAGLDVYYYAGEEQTGDPVLDFIMDPTVLGVFFSVLIVAIILLFVTTFVAIVRSEITERGANPKGPIFGRALRSILYFVMVPVVSILGIFMANVFLKTLDMATNPTEKDSLSAMVFQAAAYDGNRARNNADLAAAFAADFGLSSSMSQADIANAIDDAFGAGAERETNFPSNPYDQDYMFTLTLTLSTSAMYLFKTYNYCCFPMVYYYYDLLFGYDYLIGFIGGFIACSILLSTCLGCIQRIFELTILFVISPPIIAMMPVDNGSKYNSWRGEFIKRVMALYGPIIGLNLAFMILTIIGNYSMFPDTATYALFNRLVKMFFMIVCLISVKEFSGMISGLIGSSDALAQGEGKKEATTKMASKIGTAGVQMAKMGTASMSAMGNRLAKHDGPIGAIGKGMAKVGDKMQDAQLQANRTLGGALDVLNKSPAGQILKTAGLDKYTDINKLNEAKGFGKELFAGGLEWDSEKKEFKNKKDGWGDSKKDEADKKAAKDAAEAAVAQQEVQKPLEKAQDLRMLADRLGVNADGDVEINGKNAKFKDLSSAEQEQYLNALMNRGTVNAEKNILNQKIDDEIAALKNKRDVDMLTGDSRREVDARISNLEQLKNALSQGPAAGGVQDNILDIENILRGLKAEGIPLKDSAMVSGMSSIKEALDGKMGEIAGALGSLGENMGKVSGAIDTMGDKVGKVGDSLSDLKGAIRGINSGSSVPSYLRGAARMGEKAYEEEDRYNKNRFGYDATKPPK